MISRQSIGQGGWAAAEYLAYPILMFLSTPYFIRQFGTERYGQWMLLVALSSIGGLGGLGMGAATTREVSRLRGESQIVGIERVVENSIAVSMIGSLIIALIFFVAWHTGGDDLIARMGTRKEVLAILGYSAVIIALEQMDAVFTGTIRGFERFDIGARIEIGLKILSVCFYLVCATFSSSSNALFAAVASATLIKMLAKGFGAANLVGVKLFLPTWDTSQIRCLLVFGKWTWLQSLSAAMFAAADRLLVGALLGANSLAQYSICVQLAQQIHAIPGAAAGIVFPGVSRKIARGEPIKRSIVIAFLVVAAIAVAIAVPIISLAPIILKTWLGSSFHEGQVETVTKLSFAYVVLAFSIVPHYALLGIGKARPVAVSNILAGILSVILCVVLIPAFGLLGAVYSRLGYSLVVVSCLGAVMLYIRRLNMSQVNQPMSAYPSN